MPLLTLANAEKPPPALQRGFAYHPGLHPLVLQATIDARLTPALDYAAAPRLVRWGTPRVRPRQC